MSITLPNSWSPASAALAIGGILCPPAATAQLAPPPLATAQAPLVFRGVTVVDVRQGQRLPDRTVVIVDRRIQAITDDGKARVPKGARVVDARGKYLMPGLWDMHAHVQKYADLVYPLLVANGITGVRDPGSEVPLATLNQWKQEVAAGRRVGPRHLVSGPAIDEADSTQTRVVPGEYQFIRVPRALLPRVVDSLKAAGADFIKTYFLSREGYFTVAAEARRIGILFGGHVPADANSGRRGLVGGRAASDSGATLLDHEPYLLDHVCGGGHPDSFDLARCRAAGEHFRQHNTWITVLAQTAVGGLTGQDEQMRVVRARQRARHYLPHLFPRFDPTSPMYWSDSMAAADARTVVREPTGTADWAPYQEGALPLTRWHEAGLPMVVGTDMNLLPVGWYDLWTPGFVQQEALLGFVLAGMTPLEAMQTATLNPALALRATDSLGTAETGKVADLVLLDGDPLADIWNITKIRAVVANGRYYDRAALDQLLAQAEQVAARQ